MNSPERVYSWRPPLQDNVERTAEVVLGELNKGFDSFPREGLAGSEILARIDHAHCTHPVS